MFVKELKANIEYYPGLEIYKVILLDFVVPDEDGNTAHPTIHLTTSEIPTKYADQSPLFSVGDLIDRVYDKDDGNYFGEGFREYFGRITDIEIRKFNDRSPKRVFYYTDIWTKRRSNGIPQHGVQLSLNPHID